MKFTLKGMMIVIFGIFFCCLAAAAPSDKDELTVHNIKKRNVWQFGNMIQCAQGRNTWFPFWAFSKYGNYGCWCGRNGQGTPLDGTDRCCFEHDMCYIRVRDHLLATSQIAVKRFLSVYNYECFDDSILCDNNNEEFKNDLCDCDRIAAKCLSDNRLTYEDLYTDAYANGNCVN